MVRGRRVAGCRVHPVTGKAPSLSRRLARDAFTLVELLIVISIIGIIAGMVISSYSNAAQDSRRVVALQQQVEIQAAINNWIAAQPSLGAARTAYNGADGSKTSLQRLNEVGAYLDPTTLAQFEAAADGRLQSDVMERIGASIALPTWSGDSYPQVDLVLPD